MQHPEEGTIHAWLDGALPADEAAALESHIAECAECAARVAEARGLMAASSRIVGALDVIPSGVIPQRKPGRRAWYMSTQFRAAAAVVIVAGASLLVIRGGQKAQVEKSMAPAIGKPMPTLAAAPSAEASAVAKPETKSKPMASANDVAQATPRKPKTRIVAQQAPSSVAAPAVALSAAAASRPQEEGSRSRVEEPEPGKAARALKVDSTNSRRMLSEVVVTGVATATVDGLRQLRSDTTAVATTTVFEYQPGVEVTLVEIHARGFAPVRTGVTLAAPKAAAQALPPPPVAATAADEAKKVINSISWTDKHGRTETLSGPLSKEQLEIVRRLLPPDKR